MFQNATGHARVNVMLVSEDGKRRRVHRSSAFNMDDDPDCDLELDVHAGVSGEAFTNKRPVVGDLTVPSAVGMPSWRLDAAENARVRRTLKSILSVPVFDPSDSDGAPLATLQVDTDVELAESGLAEEHTREVVERFADVVSFLLDVRR